MREQSLTAEEIRNITRDVINGENSHGKLLLEAHSLINAERQSDYGDPSESFKRIARLWSAYLHRKISGRDVAVCMALLKISRESYEHKHDNLLDAAGYIGLAADSAEREEGGEE